MLDNNLINPSKQTEFSVSEISAKIKTLLEHNFGLIKIKGEISGLKIASSGHGYFSLKDDKALIAAICWRHNLAKLNFKLQDGIEIIVTGKITAYAGQSKYQISVDSIDPAGIGTFMQILKERKKKLSQEGLFDAIHKKQLPFLPKRIGVITSITGAVIKDIIHRISDRCPTHLIIFPVSVQGDQSADEITQGIECFNRLATDKKPDVIIIARGGGSIEDLWSFNEEIVIRATYASTIPIISAVGHETDYTLLDLVADLRAPTPTAAAEFATPIITDLQYTIKSLYTRIYNKLTHLLKYFNQVINGHDRALKQVINTIASNTQKIDDLSFRLLGSLPNLLQQKTCTLQAFSAARLAPSKIIHYKYIQYQNITSHLSNKKQRLFYSYEQKLEHNVSLLKSLDYRNVLKRGFAMVQNHQGEFVSYVRDISHHSTTTLTMQDGTIKLKSNIE